MYTRLILTAFIFLLNLEVKGQTEEYIIYDLPVSVLKKAKEYIEGYITNNDSTQFIAELSKNIDGHYVLFIINYDFEGLENFKLLDEGIIKKTNRMVRISDDYLLPLITSEDLQFAHLGSVPARNGKQGRKKVLFTHESYSITFDPTGKIYKN